MEAHLVEGIKVPGESVSSASSLHWCHQAAVQVSASIS